jgi:hypothetical protein
MGYQRMRKLRQNNFFRFPSVCRPDTAKTVTWTFHLCSTHLLKFVLGTFHVKRYYSLSRPRQPMDDDYYEKHRHVSKRSQCLCSRMCTCNVGTKSAASVNFLHCRRASCKINFSHSDYYSKLILKLQGHNGPYTGCIKQLQNFIIIHALWSKAVFGNVLTK